MLLLLDPAAWRTVTAVPGLPAYLLGTAEAGGQDDVLVLLARHGVQARAGPET